MHHAVEEARRFEPRLFGGHLDARHLRLGGFTEHLVVVDAEHRNLLRHSHTRLQAGVEDLPSPHIVGHKDRGGLRQRFQPVAERRLFHTEVLAGCRRKLRVDRAGESALRQTLAECGSALFGPGRIVNLADESEMTELPLEKIFRRACPDRAVVAHDLTPRGERIGRIK